MHTIILEDFGTFLGKKGDRLVVKKKGKTLGEFPISQVERVIISSSGASLSSSAIYLAVENRVPVTFTYSGGTPFGFITPTQGHGTVLTRRAQYIHSESEKATHLSMKFVEGKITNQKNLLLSWAKNRTRTAQQIADTLFKLSEEVEQIIRDIPTVKGDMNTDVRQSLMNLEGLAASHYWEGVAAIVPDSFAFSTRNKRGATDPFNMLLNYGYGILYSQVWSAVNIAGLDPFAGFLHVDRPGRPSLVLDLIEEFRQQVVDRVIVRLTTKQVLQGESIIEDAELSKPTREVLAKSIIERLNQAVDYASKKVAMKNIIVRQAWNIAKYLKDEATSYRPFTMRW